MNKEPQVLDDETREAPVEEVMTDENSKGFKSMAKEHGLDVPVAADPIPPKTENKSIREVMAELVNAEDTDNEVVVVLNGSDYFNVTDVDYDEHGKAVLYVK